MPEPARLTTPFMGYPLTVNKLDVRKVQLLVKADGTGEAVLPIRKRTLKEVRQGTTTSMAEFVIVLNIPGSAVSVIATMMAAQIGFTINVDSQSFVGSFMLLTLK